MLRGFKEEETSVEDTMAAVKVRDSATCPLSTAWMSATHGNQACGEHKNHPTRMPCSAGCPCMFRSRGLRSCDRTPFKVDILRLYYGFEQGLQACNTHILVL